jgi:hypothetical protein
VLWALRKRRENLEPEEPALLDRLFEASPSLRKAYNLREKLGTGHSALHIESKESRLGLEWSVME